MFQGTVAVIAATICCAVSTETSSSITRKTRGLVSVPSTGYAYGTDIGGVFNGYVDHGKNINSYENYGSLPIYNGYHHNINSDYIQQPIYDAYQYPVEDVKRYAVKEEVDEGFVTTTRPVYLPRQTPRPPVTSNNGWTPIIPRTNLGKSIFIPNSQQFSNQIQTPADPVTSIRTNYVPVEKVVGVPVAEPYSVPVYQPYPVAVAQPYPVQVPLPVQVQSTVAVPVEKPVPVPVVKHIPYDVVKNEPVPVPLPYPVPVPLYKTKYVVHTKTKK